jgi:hypothetical protein
MTDTNDISLQPKHKSFAENTETDSNQWKTSMNSSQYCRWDELREPDKSQLKQEDKFTKKIDGYRYTVKDYDGKWLVFRRNLEDVKAFNGYKNSTNSSSISEIKVVPLNEANGYLRSENHEYHIFGNDPVKVIKDEIFVVMSKRNSDPPVHSKVN